MSRYSLAPLFLTLGLWSHNLTGETLKKEPPLKDLLSSSELNHYEGKTKYRDRMELFEKVLKRYDRALRARVKMSQIEKAFELLVQIRALSQYITEETLRSARPKDLRSRQVRKLEIRLRNLIETIGSLQLGLLLKHQPQFEATSEALSISRSRLLVQIFGKALASRSRRSEQTARIKIQGLLKGFFRPESSGGSRTTTSSSEDDRFTLDEYTMIRESQKLVKRVNSFLTIAEARLKEIHRRLEKKEWEEKEENPLQFHTFCDLIHAYERALDSIMTNIDEKARYNLAQEKDIRKALKKLNEKVIEFIPKLVPLKERAIKLKDENLYKEVIQAEETSEIARDGSELGLGLVGE